MTEVDLDSAALFRPELGLDEQVVKFFFMMKKKNLQLVFIILLDAVNDF